MSNERIRLTITVKPEVHAVFARMAEASGVSLGKCMGDWLGDTVEGAEFVARKVEEARKAPKRVLREVQAMTTGLHESIGQRMDAIGSGGRPLAGGPAANGAEHLEGIIQRAKRASPPSSNTGGKVPGKTRRSSGGANE